MNERTPTSFGGALAAGRKGEGDVIRSYVDSLSTERASDVAGILVLGGENSGRSRFVAKVLSEYGHSEVTVLFAQVLPQTRVSSFGVVLSLLSPLFDGEGPYRKRIESALAEWGPRFAPYKEPLCTLFAVGAGETDVGRDAMNQILADFILEYAEESPLVLSIDDLQNIDQGSFDVISRLVPRRGLGSRYLIVATASEEDEVISRIARDAYRVISLGPFDTGQIKAYVEELGGERPDPASAAFVAHLAEVTRGEPVNLIEYLQDLFERGLISRDDFGWTFPHGAEGLGEAGSVEEIVARRAARLSDFLGSILTTAAGIGHRFPTRLLLEVTDYAEPDLSAGLETLRSREFLLTRAGESYFPHAAARRAISSRLTPEIQNRISEEVVDAWESRKFNSGQLRTILLDHLRRSRRVDLLVRQLIREAEIAYDRLRIEEAEMLAEEAAAKSWPSRLEGTWLARLHLVRSRVALERGGHEEAQVRVEEALRKAEEYGDDRTKSEGFYHLGRVNEAVGRIDLADAAHRIALRVAEETGNIAVTYLCLGALGRHAIQAGNLTEAEIFFSRAVALARTNETLLDLDHALTHLARVLEQQKKLGRAKALFEEITERSVRRGDQLSRRIALQSLGRIAMAEGRLEDAEDYMDRAEASARTSGSDRDQEIALVYQARVLVKEGRYREAETKLFEALEIARRIKTVRGQAIVYGLLGRVNEGLGRMEEAERAYTRCLELNRTLHGRAGQRAESIAINYLAEFAERRGDLDRARGLLRKSLLLAEEAGDRRGVPLIRSWLERLQE